jgi:hypothetical protein
MRDWVCGMIPKSPSFILADWTWTMPRKSRNPNFDQTLENLRARSFDVAEYPGVAGGKLVSKYGAAAVLVGAPSTDDDGAGALAVRPGILIRGEVARLLDRGYQKFIKTAQFELPATAPQLQAIHQFTEELNKVTGAMGLYNEGLGTTSDVYQYDRLRGREAPQAAAVRPWELTEGH